MGEKQDDEEMWGLEGGYHSSDRGLSRHSLDFHSGKLGENLSDESEGEQEEEGMMGRMNGVHYCLQEQKQGFAK
jgi:hypothetical protein